MATLNGVMISSVFLCLISFGTLTSAIVCNRKSCVYLSVVGGFSSLFRKYGSDLFQECSCSALYGLTFTTPSTPITDCGRSAVAGAASSYLNKPSSRIVGGQEVKQCQYPWQVYIRTPNGNCGGTIVDKTHIITVAHCGILTTLDKMSVGGGSSNKERLIFFPISKIDRHPLYDPQTKKNDIAVITLAEELEYNVCIQPACLPSQTLNISSGVQCLATGWGLTSDGPSNTQPDVLQEAIIPILNPAFCYNAYRSLMDENKICAGYVQGGIDSCEGDSGGPLMCADGDLWVLSGVISFGYGCARQGFPGVYTNVLSYLSWLQSII